MKIKALYRRFRAWQEEPFRFVNRNKGALTCANCGNEVTSNYCPVCSQRAGVGHIGWKAVYQNFMMLWGMESGSFLNTLLQLLLRPGHLIHDYISGRRQISYPPVKMLFVVVVFISLLDKYVFPDPSDVTISAATDAVSRFEIWLFDNPAWLMLFITLMMLLPTWVVFRFSPLHQRHSLPEGFFIQVFMATLVALLLCLGYFISEIFAYFIFLYYYIVYLYFFGYGIWGTLWRFLACCYFAIFGFLCVIDFLQFFAETGTATQRHPVVEVFLLFMFIAVPLGIVNRINKHTACRRKKIIQAATDEAVAQEQEKQATQK